MRSMIIVELWWLNVLLCFLITHSLCLHLVWVPPKNDTIMPRAIVSEKAEKVWSQDPKRAAEFRKVLDDFDHVLWEVWLEEHSFIKTLATTGNCAVDHQFSLKFTDKRDCRDQRPLVYNGRILTASG